MKRNTDKVKYPKVNVDAIASKVKVDMRKKVYQPIFTLDQIGVLMGHWKECAGTGRNAMRATIEKLIIQAINDRNGSGNS